MIRRERLVFAFALALLALTARGASAQAPSIELHEIAFYIHIDTLGADSLATYQAAIDDALVDAQLILQGEQGLVDFPCCTEIVRAGSLATFGETLDGFDVIDFEADVLTLRAITGGQPSVFIVDSLLMCGGAPATTAIGCAETPPCGAAASEVAVITLRALDYDLLGATIAHERGHNACLRHPASPNPCDLMNAVSGGSCLPSADCTTFRNAGTATSPDSCVCFADATHKLADGSACSDGALSGICSGGVCGAIGQSASAGLVAAVDPMIGGVSYDDLASGSGLTGDWQLDGMFGSGALPTGLAYAADRGVLYAVQVSSSGLDGELLELDPANGNVTNTITLPGLPGLISLAYDPGAAGTADDRLLAIDRQPMTTGPDRQIEALVEIDPDDGTSGPLCAVFSNSHETDDGFLTGLAYDSANDRLFGAGAAGLFEIDEAPPTCPFDLVDHPKNIVLARFQAGLGYSADTELLYMIGNQVGERTLFTEIDAAASPDPEFSTTLEIDALSVGGLAAMLVPEPGAQVLAAAALLTLAALRRVRRHSTAMRPTARS